MLVCSWLEREAPDQSMIGPLPLQPKLGRPRVCRRRSEYEQYKVQSYKNSMNNSRMPERSVSPRFAHDHPLKRGQEEAFFGLLTERGIGPAMWNMIAESGIFTAFLGVVVRGASIEDFAALLKTTTGRWHHRVIDIDKEHVRTETLFDTYPGLPDLTQEARFWDIAVGCGTGRFAVRLRRLIDPNREASRVPYEVNMPTTDGYAPAALCQVLAYASEMFRLGLPVPTKILVPGCTFVSEITPSVAIVPLIITEPTRAPRFASYRFSLQAGTLRPVPYIHDSFMPHLPFWVAEAKPNGMCV